MNKVPEMKLTFHIVPSKYLIPTGILLAYHLLPCEPHFPFRQKNLNSAGYQHARRAKV